MGFFDSRWIVEFEYYEGIFTGYKKGSIVVEASSEYDAKSVAKKSLSSTYRELKIKNARRSNGKADESGRMAPTVTSYDRSSNYYINQKIKEDEDRARKERELLQIAQRELERERRMLRDEREKLEFERWYSSLTPDEQKKYDEEQRKKAEQEKIEREILLEKSRILEEERIKEAAINAEKRRKNRIKKRILFVSISASIIVAIVLVTQIPKWVETAKFNKSLNGQVYNYLEKNSKKLSGDIIELENNLYKTSYNYKNSDIEMAVYYDDLGISSGYGSQGFVSGGNNHFFAMIKWMGDSNATYDICNCSVVFNWEDLSTCNYVINSIVNYGTSSVSCHYNAIRNDVCPAIYFGNVYYEYSNWEKDKSTEEAETCGWNSALALMYCLNQLSYDVFSTSLW